MDRHEFIFISGLHRSGTSLLHEILRAHPEISGIKNSPAKAYEDEGQFLQSVYPIGAVFGGPGKFAFDPASHMTEAHELASAANAETIFAEWSEYWDLERRYLIEKSPPNIVRTRFLQALFPQSKFITVLRHPVAVSYATIKWSKSNIPELIEHWLVAYERYLADMPKLGNVLTLRYEQFVQDPQVVLDEIYQFLELDSMPLTQRVSRDINTKYFQQWQRDRRRLFRPVMRRIPADLEARAAALGYSLEEPEKLSPLNWSL